MDESFELPREPRLSNSIFKNRPIPPHARTKIKPTISVKSDDNESPSENVESSVVYRDRNPHSSNRHQNVLLPQSPTLFYVTSPPPPPSSIFDESSKSDTSSNPSTLSVNDFSMPFSSSSSLQRQMYV